MTTINKKQHTRIRPLSNKVFVKVDEPKETTKSGIFFVATSINEQCTGTIVSVGPGETDEDGNFTPMKYTEGDRVVFVHKSGEKVKIGEEDLLMVSDKTIMGIIE